jgi:peptidoglycan/LPS O-acetylase OafA/YrhL
MNPSQAAETLTADTRLRLPFLDGLRALAALWVVLGHCHLFAYNWRAHESIWTKVVNVLLYLHLGVVVFLVLSGFCLALPVVRNQNRLSKSVWEFFKGRIMRILPPYFAILCVILLINFEWPIVAWGRHPNGLTPTIPWDVLLVNFSLMQDFFPGLNTINGPFWSIATEWHLYFFFPLLVLVLRKLGALVAFVLSCLFAAAIVWISGHPPEWVSQWHMTILTPPYFFYLFVFGVFAAWWSFGENHLARRAKQWMLVPLFTCACIWFAQLMQANGVSDTATAARFAAHAKTIDMVFSVIVAITLIGLAGSSPAMWVRRFLESKIMTKIGHFSYSLYLVHIPVVACVNHAIEQLELPTNLMHLHFILLAVFGTGISLLFAKGFSMLFETNLWWRWMVRK